MLCQPHRSKFLLGVALIGALTTTPVFARSPTPAHLPVNDSSLVNHPVDTTASPSALHDLQERQRSADGDTGGKNLSAADQDEQLAMRIRAESIKEAALSYGARGGLAWRTQQIMDKIDLNAPALDKTFNFRRLLIDAPSNLLIEPPIITEALNAFVVNGNGNEAAVSDAVYNISRQARIVGAPRHWRQYLERSWDAVAPPPDILLPETAQERKNWRMWIGEGWEQGIMQADDTFQSDLNRLTADFEGMVRYRNLLTQGKVSAPYAVLQDRGVTGGGGEMRVGDRAVKISGPAQLINRDEVWVPPQRQ